MIDIERLAREAGFTVYNGCCDGITADLKRFAQIIRNQALEDAANVCDEEAEWFTQCQQGAGDGRYDWKEDAADACAHAIRTMKKDQQ